MNFWIRVYTEVTTNEGFLHDERNLAVVYDTLKFGAGTSSRERQRMVDDRRERHIATLRRIAAALPTEAGREALSEEDKRVLAMWGPNVSVILLRDATQRIRFQLGQSDRFKEGLIRSSSWETHIAETFANQGLPPELAVLPHVESSFNAAAYSKVGAAGLWQFMRSTGRRYMRIDDAVDERLDPYRSTEAAAQLLAYNYRVLGSWPLALTAYNHGAAGMRRAKETVGTDDFVKINRTYNSRTFGFASRNFFPSFLAALTIDENPEKYFGQLQRRPEIRNSAKSPMPAYVRLTTLERTLGVDREQLRALNPAWRPTIYQGTRLVPRGYRLRLPADTAETMDRGHAGLAAAAQRVVCRADHAAHPPGAQGRIAGQHRRALRPDRRTPRRDERHFAQRAVARWSSPAAARAVAARDWARRRAASRGRRDAGRLAAERHGRQRAGRGFLRGAPRRFAAGHRGASTRARGAAPEDERAQGSGPPLRGSAPAHRRRSRPAVVVAAATSEEVETKVAAIDAARGEAQREGAAVEVVREETTRPIGSGEPKRGRARSAAVVAMEAATTPDVANSVVQAAEGAREPVSASQAEDLSPALGPVSVSQGLADSIDYQVRDDGSIRVEATETLGQYADWLQIPTQSLRNLNKLKAAPAGAAGPETQARLLARVARDLRAAAPRLPRQAAGRILRAAPHRGHRGLYRAARRLAVDHDPAVQQPADLAAAPVQPGHGPVRPACRHAGGHAARRVLAGS